MASGKTDLLMRMKNTQSGILLVPGVALSRNTNTPSRVYSRSGLNAPIDGVFMPDDTIKFPHDCSKYPSVVCLDDYLADSETNVFVDECNMLTCRQIVYLDKMKNDVYLFGLEKQYTGEDWLAVRVLKSMFEAESSARLVSEGAETGGSTSRIIHLPALCKFCCVNSASFDRLVELDGTDFVNAKYSATCEECYDKNGMGYRYLSRDAQRYYQEWMTSLNINVELNRKLYALRNVESE